MKAGAAIGLGADERGAVTLEAVIALLPVLLCFLALCQIADGYAHQLLVQRAASAAARAAVVVLPDDGGHYDDPQQRTLNVPAGARKRAVEEAARLVLRASPSFSERGTAVHIVGSAGSPTLTTTTVEADYACFLPGARLFCGRDGMRRLQASASLPLQAAAYRYPRGG